MKQALLLLGIILLGSIALQQPASGQSGCVLYCTYFPAVMHSPRPTGVEIINLQYHGGRDGNASQYGEVLNTTDTPLYDVQLTTYYYNAAGELFWETFHPTLLPVVYPGEPMIFQGGAFRADEMDLPRFETFVSAYRTTSTRAYRPLTVLSYQLENHGGFATFRVQVRNDNPDAVALLGIAIWSKAKEFAPGSGGALALTLAPGETTTTRLSMYVMTEFPPDPATVAIAVQGEVVP